MAYDCHVYIGSFTPDFLTSGGKMMGNPAKGIEVLGFNGGDLTLEHLDTFPGLVSPSFLALHPELPVLYAVERRFDIADPTVGAVTSFSIDDASGHLEMTSRVESGAESPAHVSVHPSGRHAYASHYLSGHLVAFPLDAQGRVQPADTVIAHEGNGPRPRQASAHVHQARPAPDSRFLHVVDLGIDAILTYPTDSDGRPSTDASSRVSLPPGTGPRHLAWHPSRKFAFTNGELSSTLCVLGYDDERGHLEFLSAHSTLPRDFTGDSLTAEVMCHPSGRAIYVSNQGHDSLAVFSFDELTGSAEYLGVQPTFGRFPRNFNIDPSAAFLVVANQSPGNLVIYRLDPDTFWPVPTGVTLDVPTPTCVLFRPVQTPSLQ